MKESIKEEATMTPELMSRAEVLALKRSLTETRLRNAEAAGDERWIAREKAQLERITEWERESGA